MPTFRTACESSKLQQRLKSPASPPSTPCRSGTLTSSILLHNSLHKASRQLLWSSSRRQTMSCGLVYPTTCVPPCRVIMISLWTKPSKSSCSLRPLRCSCSLSPRAPSLSESVDQDLPRVHPKGVASPPPSPRAVARLSPVSRRPCKEKG